MRQKKPDRILARGRAAAREEMAARSNADFYGARVLSPQSPCRPPPLSADFRSLMECSPARAHRTLSMSSLSSTSSSTCRSGRLAAADQERNGAGRDLPRGHPRRRLGCGACDGWKWWRFHAAHIGYFNKSTLALALETAGLRVNAITRPSWRLPSSYLAERAFSHLPRPFRPALPSVLDRIVVPTNLYDSLLAVCGHSPQAAWPQRHPRSERPLSPKGHSGNVRPNLFPVELHRIRQNSSRYLIPVRVVRSATGLRSYLGITNR